jgi:hypothetical protein
MVEVARSPHEFSSSHDFRMLTDHACTYTHMKTAYTPHRHPRHTHTHTHTCTLTHIHTLTCKQMCTSTHNLHTCTLTHRPRPSTPNSHSHTLKCSPSCYCQSRAVVSRGEVISPKKELVTLKLSGPHNQDKQIVSASEKTHSL